MQTQSRQVRRQLQRIRHSQQGSRYVGNAEALRAFHRTKLYAPNGDREVARRLRNVNP